MTEMIIPAQTILKQLKNFLISNIYPHYCIGCRRSLTHQPNSVYSDTSDYALCTECFDKFQFIEAPYCKKTGIPLSYELNEDIVFGEALLNESLHYRYVRACTVFNEISRNIIHRFKYGDETYLADFIANRIFISAAEMIKNSELIIPIPINVTRMLKRRYNQSALIAQQLGRLSQTPVDLLSLRRIRSTPSQTKLSLKQRIKNVQGAFDVDHKRRYLIKNKHILLLDDLMTTGATCSQCSKILRRFGAKTVDVAVFARVVIE